jgi:chaperonin cofactor prefoldin
MLAHCFLIWTDAQGGKLVGPASIPQSRSTVAPALEQDWDKLDRRFDTAEYHRRRNHEARESHRRTASKKVS